MKMRLRLLGVILLMYGCTDRDTSVDKSKLLGTDYRLFQNTPAWELAKAVQDGDVTEIKDQVNKNKSLLNFRDPRLGQPLLKLAVMHENYSSVKTLLELGADPNIQDSDEGDSPLMKAADIGIHLKGSDPRFLKLLLKYGADPNAEESGPGRTKFTPLMIACQEGNLEYVKILLNAGAKINAVNEYGDSPLAHATMAADPEIVIYLIEKGADFRRVLYTTVPQKENKYITDALRYWRFDLGSEAYKKKIKLVDFLKANGMDYKKTAIPTEFLKDYPKEYLDKY